MPFTYRDKPKLADRLRGKSGEEILNELKSDLDPERRMFFETPSWSTRQKNTHGFPRGFPFDDDRNRINVRTYLDEIASRHPEFADQLKEPPWGQDFPDRSFERKSKGPNSGREEEGRNEASGSNQVPEEAKEPRQHLTNFGLRNTVPLGPGAVPEQERGQRSMSAPPENRAVDKSRRFVTKCEIPVMNDAMQDSAQIKPDMTGKGAQEQAQQKGNVAPNVRVIPIQVEGRDTPLVNTNVDTSTNFGAETYRDPAFEGRLPRDFGSYQKHSPRFAHKERAPTPPQYQYAPHYQQYAPPHQHFMPPQQPNFMPQQQYAPPPQQAFAHQDQHSQKPPAPPPTHQQQPPPQHQQQHHHQQKHQHHHHHHNQQHPQQHPPPQQGSKHPQGNETEAKPTPPPPPPQTKDPIEKVQMIQKEVDELMKQVESFNGNSRTDKQYLMLDELLTRQLLLLDNIDTEGKENVRQARKDTIRNIQRCISTLENKVPVPENNESSGETAENNGEEGKREEVTEGSQAMEVDQTKENTPVEGKENQKMEVDNKVTKEPQQPEEQQQQQQPKEEGKA